MSHTRESKFLDAFSLVVGILVGLFVGTILLIGYLTS